MYDFVGMVRIYGEYSYKLKCCYPILAQENIKKSVNKTVQYIQQHTDEVCEESMAGRQNYLDGAGWEPGGSQDSEPDRYYNKRRDILSWTGLMKSPEVEKFLFII